MKALMLVVYLASGMQHHPDGGFAIWFSSMQSREAAIPAVKGGMPRSMGRWSKVVCVAVSQ